MLHFRKHWTYLRAPGRPFPQRLPRWMLIVGYAGRDFVIDDGLHWAASIAFYSVLSLFPLVPLGVDLAARFIDPQTANQQAGEVLGHFMPRAEAVHDIIGKIIATRPRLGVLSMLFLLYSGGRAFAVLIRALNVACDLNEIYGFFQRLFVEFCMLLSIGGLFLAALLSSLIVPVFLHGQPTTPNHQRAIVEVTSWPLPSLLLVSGFFCLYKFVPRHRCNWQSALIGSLVSATLCAGAKPLFGLYFDRFSSASQIYGWLTVGAILMLWAQLTAIITLFGGELASHVQMMVYDGLSGEEVSHRHRLRSPGRSPARGRQAPP